MEIHGISHNYLKINFTFILEKRFFFEYSYSV